MREKGGERAGWGTLPPMWEGTRLSAHYEIREAPQQESTTVISGCMFAWDVCSGCCLTCHTHSETAYALFSMCVGGGG